MSMRLARTVVHIAVAAAVTSSLARRTVAAEASASAPGEVSFGQGVPGLPVKEGLAFKARPTARADGANIRIEFEVNKATDVAVEILDKDGKVLRHLAAGLLGPFAPEPLARESLKQALVWDRKDDDGKPVAGTCKVRVGLGLGAKRLDDSAAFDGRNGKAMPGVPWDARNVPWLRAMASGPDGTVYLMGGYYRAGKDGFPHIIAMDRDGNYLREVYPPPARLVPDRIPGLPSLKLADGRSVPRVDGWWQLYLKEMVNILDMTATAAGHLLLTDGNIVLKLGADGSVPKDVRLLKLPKGGRSRDLSIAAAPDGKSLLLSGCTSGREKAPTHAVYRIALDGSGNSQVVFGVESEAGSDEKHLKDPAGLAVDAAGNLYVADRGNDRVVVVKPDGSMARSIAVEAPFDVQLDPASGAIYALSAKRMIGVHDYALPAAVTKFDAQGKRIASVGISHKLPYVWGLHPLRYGGMVVVAGAKPSIWVGGTSYPDMNEGHIMGYTSGAVRIEDRGDALSVVANDTFREALIAAVRERKSSVNCRAAGASWLIGQDVLQRDGYRYGIAEFRPKGSGYYYELRRFAGDGMPAPFPAPPEGKWPRFVRGKPDGEGDWPSLPARMDNRFFGRTLVNFEGDILAQYYNFTLRDAPVPDKFAPMCIDKLSPNGQVKQRDFIYGIEKGHTFSPFRVDRKGHIYIAAHAMPLKRTMPAEIEAAFQATASAPDPTYVETYSSVLKMSPQGGGFKWGAAVTGGPAPTGDLMRKPASIWAPRSPAAGRQASCEGIEWLFVGIAPIANEQGQCICTASTFDIDSHARVFVPDAYRMCVSVLDTEGNLLLRFGRYGNQDDGKLALAFARPRVVGLTGQDVVTVADLEQARATRVGLVYAVEETAAVR